MSTQQVTALVLTSSIMFVLAVVSIALAYLAYESYTKKQTLKVWFCAGWAVLALFEAGNLAWSIMSGGVA